MGSRRYRAWDPDQQILFPSAMRDALDEGHIVFRILDVIEDLDISCVTDRMEEKDPRGTRPYHPRMMVAMLMYAYCCGIYSSRKIAAATYDIIPFRVLTADQHPHFTVINQFRLENLDAFVELFTQVLRLCGRAGLLDLEHVSLDGSKVQANASKHKAMSYERMDKELARLEEEIRRFSDRAQEVDAEEDAQYGEGREPQEVDEELIRREKRRKRIAEAKEELEREARWTRERELRERARALRGRTEEDMDPAERNRTLTRARKTEHEADCLAAQGDCADRGDGTLPSHRVPVTPHGIPKPKAQRNFTDPDSRIMKRDGSFLQGYNCQVAVAGSAQIVVAGAVTNQAPDQEHLIPLLEQVRSNVGGLPRRLSADAGYMSEANARYCEKHGVDAYLSVARQKHRPRNEQSRPNESPVWRAMREKLNTEEGRTLYARRKAIVEPVFGQAKEARGFRRFSLRGMSKVRAEWTLVLLCGNLLKLVNSGAIATP